MSGFWVVLGGFMAVELDFLTPWRQFDDCLLIGRFGNTLYLTTSRTTTPADTPDAAPPEIYSLNIGSGSGIFSD